MHRCEWDGTAVVAVHNLGDQPATARLPKNCDRLIDLLGDNDAEPGAEITVEPHGYRWPRTHGHR